MDSTTATVVAGASTARTQQTTQDPRWALIIARSGGSDCRFVYSVESTGIFCRPACASRRPKPANVRFHADAEAAIAAGYRPCKRCTPEREQADDRQTQTVTRICRLIDASDIPPSLTELAGVAGLSPAYLHRLFKARIGLTPKAYGNAQRAKRMRDELVRSPTVTHAVYGSGFSSSGRFYDMAHKVLGMTPAEYRAGAARLVIRYAIGSSSLGYVLVAQSDRGICAVLMDDDPRHLEQDVRKRFPHAHLRCGEAAYTRWVKRVIAAIEHPSAAHDLPLDIRGTAFQQRVWQALMAIPVGSTASYAHIAARIGSPKAIRAVAGACATNAVAVLVPCHRVVRSDGSLSGYRWGAARKKALLDRERSQRGS